MITLNKREAKMNVNAVSNFNYSNKAAMKSFKGHWEEDTALNASGYVMNERKSYVPDKNESPAEIAIAWEKETGKLPIDWVKQNNLYNQGKNINYQIKDKSYLPFSLLKASAEVKLGRASDSIDKVFAYTELAKLAAQEGNEKAQRKLETKIQETFAQVSGAKYQMMLANHLNSYKDDYGINLMYKPYKK